MLQSTSMVLTMLSLNNQLSLSICHHILFCWSWTRETSDFQFEVQLNCCFRVPSNAGCPQENGLNACRKQRCNRRKKHVDVLLKLFRFVMFLRSIWCFHFCWVFGWMKHAFYCFLRCCFQPLYKWRTAQLTSPWLALVMPTPGGLWFRNPASTPVPVSQFVGLRNPSKKGVKEKNNPISISIFPYVSIIASFLSTSYPPKKCAPLSGTSFEGKDGVFRVEGRFLLGDVMRDGTGWRHEIKLINHRPSVVYFWHHLHISSTEMFMGLE